MAAISRFSVRSCALLCFISGAALAGEALTPEGWLARMEQALSTRNYQGVFVHEHSGQTETLRIVHRIANGSVDERILSLDGSGREFIRKGGELFCYLPDQKLVLVEQSQDSGMLLTELRRVDVTASGQYQVTELAPTRVSDRRARVIAVEPRDRYRYGYRLWIDEASAMPLKTQLRAARGEVVEQMVFTELTLPHQIADALLKPATDAGNYRWLRHESLAATAGDSGSGAWQATELPPGFRMTMSAMQKLPGSVRPVTHLVFSDGMASVSVFVEQGGPAADTPPGDADVRRVGPSSAYSAVMQGRRVTAIGEVPPDTVRVIATSVLSQSPASPQRVGASTLAPVLPSLRGVSPPR
jgi:sigma-E factor negative regulatory protein RseB